MRGGLGLRHSVQTCEVHFPQPCIASEVPENPSTLDPIRLQCTSINLLPLWLLGKSPPSQPRNTHVKKPSSFLPNPYPFLVRNQVTLLIPLLLVHGLNCQGSTFPDSQLAMVRQCVLLQVFSTTTTIVSLIVLSQRVQSNYMVQSMVSVVVISLIVWVSIPHMGT